MSETPQRNENEYIQVNYDGEQINAAIEAALQMESGGMAAKKAECDGSGNNIQNTYTTKNEANQIRQDMNEKTDKSRILQYIDYTKDETNKSVTITGIKSGISRNDLVGDFVIPETIEGYPVVAIGDSAFNACMNIRSIVIPNSVRVIGQNAFNSCGSLSFVNIPNSVTDIGDQAFMYCSALSSINLPNSIIQIKSGTFAHTGLASIVIPDSVTSIGSSAFANSTSLVNVNLGQKVTSIGYQAFSVCRHLTNLFIPQSLNYEYAIGSGAFGGIDDLTNIYYGGTKEQWEGLENRPSVVSGGHIYYNQKLAKMADVEQRIEKNQCLQYLDWEIMEDGNVQILGVKQGTPSSALEGMTLYIPDLIDGKAVISIAESAFEDYWEFSSVIIPDSITIINDYAFAGCTGLTFVIIPSSLITMGVGVFEGCDNLSSITIPHSITVLDGTFKGCSALTEIIIPDSVTSIGWYTFYGCAGLTSVTIPDSVATIGYEAFRGCTSLTSVTIGDSVTTISNHAFYGCTSLTSVIIGDSVTTIGSSAFNGCTGLASVTIGDSVTSTSIGNDAFTGCNSIQTIYYGGTETQWNTLNNRPIVVSGGHIYYNQKPAVKQDIYDYHDNTKADITYVAPAINKTDYNELPENIFKIGNKDVNTTKYGVEITKINDYTFVLNGTASYTGEGVDSGNFNFAEKTFNLFPSVTYYAKMICTDTTLASDDAWIRTSYFDKNGEPVQTGDGAKQIETNAGEYLILTYPTDVDKSRFYLHIKNGITFNNVTFTVTLSTELPFSVSKADKSIVDNHIIDTNNPHEVTKSQVGLGNADNTADTDKPISTATQAALDLKADNSTVTPLINKVEYNELPENIFKIDDTYVNGVTRYSITATKINDYTFNLNGTANNTTPGAVGVNFEIAYNTFSMKQNVPYYMRLVSTDKNLENNNVWIRTSYFDTNGQAVQIAGSSNEQLFVNDDFKLITYSDAGHTVDKSRFYLHVKNGTTVNNAIFVASVSTELPFSVGKQDKLIAGTNITIDENNVISATGGGGGTVDQTYNPTSTNAQSGTAVAEAVAPINNEIANSFNSTLHKDLTDWQIPCAKFSSLMQGDVTNNVPAIKSCEPFLFFTDPHTQSASSISKFEEYMGQLQKIYNSTPTAFVLCGGDWLGNSDTPTEASYKMGLIGKTCRTMLNPCYLIVGNHDTNYQGKKDSGSATYTTRLPVESLNNLWYDGKNAYYSFDGNNTRFYCFDTEIENSSLTDFNDYGYKQAQSFANALLNETSEHIAMSMHIYFNISQKTDEIISLTDNEYILQKHPILEHTLVIKNSDGTKTRVLNTDYTFDSITGEITSINSGLENGDKATYYYYNGLNTLSRLLVQITYCFNNRTSITFNNSTYDFSNTISNSKVEYILAGHTHADFLAYHNYETINLTNEQYNITKDNIVNGSVFITDSTGSTLRSSYTVDYDNGVITNYGGLYDGDIIHYDYGVHSNTLADNTDIPIVLTMRMSQNNAKDAIFDLVFVDYDNSVIKTIRVGAGSDRIIYMGVTNNG